MNKPRRALPTLLSELAGKTIADALARQGFASTGIVTHWAEIVGPEIATHAEPMRMSWPRRVHEDAPEPATLVLRVEGPVALEIQHMSGLIIEKVKEAAVLSKIHVTPGEVDDAVKKRPELTSRNSK